MLSIVVKPETVQLVPSETIVCQGEHITFNCSANSNPAVHTYQLYVNGTKVYETNSTGIWNTTMTTGGLFVYKCVVSNKIGTTESMGVIVTVNGKHFFLSLRIMHRQPYRFIGLNHAFENKRDRFQNNDVQQETNFFEACGEIFCLFNITTSRGASSCNITFLVVK